MQNINDWIFIGILILNTIFLLMIIWKTRKEDKSLEHILLDQLQKSREELAQLHRQLREEIVQGFKTGTDGMLKTLEIISQVQQNQLGNVSVHLKNLQDSNEKYLTQMRQDMIAQLRSLQEAFTQTMEGISRLQQQQLESMSKQFKELSDSNFSALERIRDTFDQRIKSLQEGNEKRLDEIRRMVDEKLHETLEKRLGESFKLVSERLEAVHKGLGEMQTLANGVGDLKRVLTNVKVRGTWAEVQLGAILEQILTPHQYAKNVRVKAQSNEIVEYAIRIPERTQDSQRFIWLPIDSKFPQEDYLRLQDAYDRGDPEAIHKILQDLFQTVRRCAQDIRDKYIAPPETTDFAILFLPTEGLYAEVLKNSLLIDDLLRQYRVVIAGPTTLSAILCSLRIGFQTLAIERRAADVWKILGAVKTEFHKFGTILEKVKKQLGTVSRTIEDTEVRTRAMERTLRSVEELPETETDQLFLPAEPLELSQNHNENDSLSHTG